MAIESTGSESGNIAPIGADPVVTNPSVTTEPTAIELKEDSLIRIAGQDKPVKFSDYGKGFQAQFTKASQRAAALERELQTERATRQKFEQERQASQRPNQPQQDPYASLREKPYLTGEEAAELAAGHTRELQTRDQVLIETLKYIQKMEQRLGGLTEHHTNSSWESNINKWVTDQGYGPEAVDFAKEIYLAYEGNDLNQEFPRIFGERMKQMEAMFEARKRASLEKARSTPWVPGRGGQTGPTTPLQLKGNESSRQIAELLWTQAGSDT